MPRNPILLSGCSAKRNRYSGSGRRVCAQLRLRRKGAVFSVEMMMLVTVLIPIMFALTEFSLLWSAKHLLQTAAYEGCRAASLPAASDHHRILAARHAIESVLTKERFLDEDIGYQMTCIPGECHGDMVKVQLQLPMTTASPDMLGIIGISIEDEFLIVEAVTARQN